MVAFRGGTFSFQAISEMGHPFLNLPGGSEEGLVYVGCHGNGLVRFAQPSVAFIQSYSGVTSLCARAWFSPRFTVLARLFLVDFYCQPIF